jgi:hypothetical protein
MTRKRNPRPDPGKERNRKLTPKQRAFVQHYLINPNAAEAYRAAGYRVSSDTVARVEGHRLLAKPNIAAAIAAAQEVRARKLELDADTVLRRLDRESRRLGRGSSHAARVQALRLLGLHLGMFPQRLKVSGDAGPLVPLGVKELTDEQLERIIRGEDAAAGGRRGIPGPEAGPG